MTVAKDLRIYSLFKKLLLYNINGVVDNSVYEDCIRAVFLENSGVFLNFDKIFQNIFKIHKEDEFSQFIL